MDFSGIIKSFCFSLQVNLHKILCLLFNKEERANGLGRKSNGVRCMVKINNEIILAHFPKSGDMAKNSANTAYNLH